MERICEQAPAENILVGRLLPTFVSWQARFGFTVDNHIERDLAISQIPRLKLAKTYLGEAASYMTTL